MQTRQLETIKDRAGDILQKSAEVQGMLESLDIAAEEAPGLIPDHIVWSIRLAYRVIGDINKDASRITEEAEEIGFAARREQK